MKKKTLLSIFILLLTAAASRAADDNPVVLIVHPSNVIDNVTVGELNKIYQGKKARWQDGQNIMVLNHPVKSPIRTLFFRVILGASPGKQFYQPGSPAPFKTTIRQSDRSIRRFVGLFPNAIGYIHKNASDNRTKVITISGVEPDDNAYPLK